MLVHSRQPLRFDPAPALVIRNGDQLAGRWTALVAAATAFFCFMPYPAYAVGNASAIQIGNVLAAMACLPLLMMSWRCQPFYMYLLLMAPPLFSVMGVVMQGHSDAALSFKTIAVWGLSLMAMLSAQILAPRYALQMLTGIACATLLHTAVGLWQLHSFRNGVFPMPELYVNPSFLSVQDHATTIARWVQRPFGIFPEPSAMSSSLAPWVLFWSALWCGVVRLKQPPRPWQRRLFAAAAAGGLALIFLSRSGHAAVTMAALLLIIAMWFVRCRTNVRNALMPLAVFGLILPAALLAAGWAVEDRLGGSRLGNSSWEDRASSMVIGFELMTSGDVSQVLLGMGPGLSSRAVTESAGLEAVWSVLLNYLYDTGLFGVIAVCFVGLYLLRVWKSLRWDLSFIAIAGVWLVGITITTSYDQLLPLWLTLGWLTVWPAFAEPVLAPVRAAQQITAANQIVRSRSRWSTGVKVQERFCAR